jgi:uncharacterized protein (TIGR03435 family)
MRMLTGGVFFALAVFLSGGLLAQAIQLPRDDQKLSFDVASIKPSNSRRPSSWSFSGGRQTILGVSARMLILHAFRLEEFQLFGGPSWLESERFDVIGQFTGATPQQFPAMERALLEERFALKTHRETRQGPIYHLVLARNDSRLGPQLRKSPIECAEFMRSGGKVAHSLDPRAMSPCTGFGGGGRWIVRTHTIPRFATFLQGTLQQTVVDQTGLTGEFDIDLEWSTNPADTSKPSIFIAVQEQLGLKLEAARGPIEVVVIDSVEHPTAD